MSVHEIPTLRPMQVPVTLVVGGSERLIGAVSEAAISAQLLVAECTLVDAMNTAAEMRPLVIVLPRDVYEAEREGLDLLARDIRAKLLVVESDTLDPLELEQQLAGLMSDAENQRPSWAGEMG